MNAQSRSHGRTYETLLQHVGLGWIITDNRLDRLFQNSHDYEVDLSSIVMNLWGKNQTKVCVVYKWDFF